MDQRFSVFSLEKYRLQLQRGARSFYEDEISSEKVIRPNKLSHLMSHIVTVIASSRMFKKKDGILENPQRITNQSYIE
jgi:hypothetical protein